jgi:hypothetical protein
MQIVFIEQEQTELSAKKEELESVDCPWEDPQQSSVNQKRSKPHMTKELEMRFVRKFGACGNEDSVSIE